MMGVTLAGLKASTRDVGDRSIKPAIHCLLTYRILNRMLALVSFLSIYKKRVSLPEE